MREYGDIVSGLRDLKLKVIDNEVKFSLIKSPIDNISEKKINRIDFHIKDIFVYLWYEVFKL